MCIETNNAGKTSNKTSLLVTRVKEYMSVLFCAQLFIVGLVSVAMLDKMHTNVYFDISK